MKHSEKGFRSAHQAKQNPKRKSTDEHIIPKILSEFTIFLSQEVTELEFQGSRAFMMKEDPTHPYYYAVEMLGKAFCIKQNFPFYDGKILYYNNEYLIRTLLYKRIAHSRAKKITKKFNQLPTKKFILAYDNGKRIVRDYKVVVGADILKSFKGILPTQNNVPPENRILEGH